MNKMLSNKKTIAIFILPAILIFTLIIPVPLIMSVGLSFLTGIYFLRPNLWGSEILSNCLQEMIFSECLLEIHFNILDCLSFFKFLLLIFLLIIANKRKRFESL